jgi:polysaccharide deacetylase 2 family uncharacterized protein YibQ
LKQPKGPFRRWRLPLFAFGVFFVGIGLGIGIGMIAQPGSNPGGSSPGVGPEKARVVAEVPVEAPVEALTVPYTEFRTPLPSHEPPAPPPTPTTPGLAAVAPSPSPAAPVVGGGPLPAWLRHAANAASFEGRSRIAVVIDDLGIDRRRSARAVTLPPPLTFSYLPYARDLPQQTADARAAGHELLVHLPMEPTNGANPGPRPLLTGLSRAELLERLRWDLDRFPAFVGVSNHMGSRFTADSQTMETVLEEIAARGLLFLDSRTTAKTVAPRLARRLGVPFAERNVFLDNDSDLESVRKRLAELEKMASHHGYAVGIGHPYDATLEALAGWLPTLEDRGFVLVPISSIVWRNLPEERRVSLARAPAE